MRILLDTTVLIDVLRGRPKRRQLIASLIRDGHSLLTSVVNVAEIYAGMRPVESEATEELLNALDCVDVTFRTARLAGSLKQQWSAKGVALSLADTMIAAAAIESQCALMTDDQKHSPMPELRKFPL